LFGRIDNSQSGGNASLLSDEKVEIHFYEVGTGARSSFKYDDHEPFGRLLNEFCRNIGLRRTDCRFEVWDTEVTDQDTWHALQKKHKLEQNFAIDVVSARGSAAG
jgi:hypothetical protein